MTRVAWMSQTGGLPVAPPVRTGAFAGDAGNDPKPGGVFVRHKGAGFHGGSGTPDAIEVAVLSRHCFSSVGRRMNPRRAKIAPASGPAR